MAETNAPRRRRGPERGNRIAVFWVEVGYLLVLALLGWAYFTPDAPAWLKAPATYGLLPSGVLWFGGLGGVLISLSGVHEHRDDWESRFWTWHVVRPLVGAAVGTIAVLIVMSGILAVGADPTPATEAPATGAAQPPVDTKNLFYFLVAFVVGYRETHFRDLIKRLGDVLFTSKETPTSTETAKAATIVSLDPAEGPAVGGTLVRIAGTGFDGASAVRFGAEDAEFERVSDAQIDATSPGGDAGEISVTVVTTSGTVTGGSFTYR